MKALIYKEFKLSMHPICYLFIALFPLMILIPKYPIAIGFIYVLTCYPILFLGANKGQQSNDLLYSTLLPVRKKDIVLARIITVISMQVAFVLIMSALYPLAVYINGSISADQVPQGELKDIGFGLQSFVLMLSTAIIGYAICDLIFFPIYYKNGRSIVMSTLLMILGYVVYIGVVTIALPLLIPGMNALPIGIQFACLGVAILVAIALHIIVYKISYKNLEKVDF